VYCSNDEMGSILFAIDMAYFVTNYDALKCMYVVNLEIKQIAKCT